MKYILFLLITVSFTSCSLSGSPKAIVPENTISPVSTGGLQDSNSGTSLLGESGSVVISDNGTISVENNTGKVLLSGSGKNSTGTGKTGKGNKALQDAELKSIEQDINALFSEIENGGK